MTKQELQKQLDEAYARLSNLRDRNVRRKGDAPPERERVLQQHIRYLRQLIQEAS